MKFNLKTFPKHYVDEQGHLKYVHGFIHEVLEWKKGFEKELIEKLQSMEPRTTEHILIQEILGEILVE